MNANIVKPSSQPLEDMRVRNGETSYTCKEYGETLVIPVPFKGINSSLGKTSRMYTVRMPSVAHILTCKLSPKRNINVSNMRKLDRN